MYRLLATDIDDTILADDGSMPEANRTALQHLHRNGYTIVFSSGRASTSMQGIVEKIVELDDDEYLISYNGARIVEARSVTPVLEWLVPRDVIEFAIEYARANHMHIQGYVNDQAFTTGETPGADAYRDEYLQSAQMEVKRTDDLAARIGPSTPKLLLIDDPARIPDHIEKLMEQSNGRYRATRSKPHYLEIVHPSASKGYALTRLAEKLGIAIEETIAVGDSHNDVEMIQAAGLGIAVANAVPEVKAIADIVLERTAGDGAIAEIVERFF